mmetsp:Transcript_20566/g.30922  ORF Transcript_20566/g.30922 Transcript_20566/m.30922 type:complete len:83 (-) Transcript_20566:600-848(-)
MVLANPENPKEPNHYNIIPFSYLGEIGYHALFIIGKAIIGWTMFLQSLLIPSNHTHENSLTTSISMIQRKGVSKEMNVWFCQ